jgi:hypothetical protein
MAYYNIYYPTSCDSAVPDHVCSNCDDIEHGRVRSIAFIKKSFSFTDPTNPAEWRNGITNKDIIIIPDVNGTFDGGSEQEADGYGDQQTKIVGYNFVLNYKDPSYKGNADFYNGIKKSLNYEVAYRTETQVHFSGATVEVVPKNPVTANTTDEVTWDVTVKWSAGDSPKPYDAPLGTFQCFDYL